jgi:hypothetical protein
MTTTTMTATTRDAAMAQGKVIRTSGDFVIFAPWDTAYQLHLLSPGYDGPLDVLVRGVIRVTARKAYTVPSGGNFISPIFGPPRTIQGRVRSTEGNTIVVQAGVPVHVAMPLDPSAVELANGPIAAGSLINIAALPGASFEPVATR